MVRDDFDLVAAFGRSTIDMVFSQAAFEHFDDLEATIAGTQRGMQARSRDRRGDRSRKPIRDGYEPGIRTTSIGIRRGSTTC